MADFDPGSQFMGSNFPAQSMPQYKKPGMFGGGNLGSILAAALSGYTASSNPAPQQALFQMMQQRRQQQLEDSQYQRHRADDNSDFQAHRQYEIANPLPQQPGEFEQTLIASGIQPGTPEWTQAMVTRRQNMLDPPVMTPQGMMLRSQVVGGGGGQPAPANVTFTPIPDGGQTPPASGGFPY